MFFLSLCSFSSPDLNNQFSCSIVFLIGCAPQLICSTVYSGQEAKKYTNQAVDHPPKPSFHMASNGKELSNNGKFRTKLHRKDSYKCDGYRTENCLKEVIEDHKNISFLAANPDQYKSGDIPACDSVDLASQRVDAKIKKLKKRMRTEACAEAVGIWAGIAAVDILRDHALPHVVAGIGEMWNAVKAFMKS